jgi:hypothetical protein
VLFLLYLDSVSVDISKTASSLPGRTAQEAGQYYNPNMYILQLCSQNSVELIINLKEMCNDILRKAVQILMFNFM